jgi:hypothetical protein
MAGRDQDRTKEHGKGKVQGEGDYDSARRYGEDVRNFVERENVEEAAEKAKKSYESSEREELERAEKEGKDRAKEFDPQVKRD